MVCFMTIEKSVYYFSFYSDIDGASETVEKELSEGTLFNNINQNEMREECYVGDV